MLLECPAGDILCRIPYTIYSTNVRCSCTGSGRFGWEQDQAEVVWGGVPALS